MFTELSRDGTRIACDIQGSGPAVILIDGALCTRSSGSKPDLVKLLASHFTVYSNDRRGRGDSSDTKPYAIEKEVEDIESLIDNAGGSAFLYGHRYNGKSLRHWRQRLLMTTSQSWAKMPRCRLDGPQG